MSVAGVRDMTTEAALVWAESSAHSHRLGGTEYRLGKREIGHIPVRHAVGIPFPTTIPYEIVAAGDAQAHHILPDSGWVSACLRNPADVDRALAWLRRSCDIAASLVNPTEISLAGMFIGRR